MARGELRPEQLPMTAGTGGDQGCGAVESDRERSPQGRGHGVHLGAVCEGPPCHYVTQSVSLPCHVTCDGKCSTVRANMVDACVLLHCDSVTMRLILRSGCKVTYA